MKLLKNDKTNNDRIEKTIRDNEKSEWETVERVDAFYQTRGGFHQTYVTLDYIREFKNDLGSYFFEKLFTEMFFIYKFTTDEEELIYVKNVIREFTDEFYNHHLDIKDAFKVYVPLEDGKTKTIVLSPWNYDRLLKRKNVKKN